MTVNLHIADGLVLPEDAVTETFAILAKRGSGKTYAAGVLVEEMLAARLPVCVIDPLGVWWGLRSSADGKSEGEPVVIFGGDHADVPLQETAGELIADVIVNERISVVLDLSGLTKSAQRRFMTDFAERLYHRNREVLHLVVDEADAFAPQRPQRGAERLLGAMEDLVRRGRGRGIGCTMITQRPAVLNKDVLTQIEALLVLRMTGPRDVAAIDEWVKLHATEEQAREVKASLPSLPIGTAWLWSPGWLDILRRITIRTKRTFDSSATPKAGKRPPAPRKMASVDLATLGERIAATAEEEKAKDPRLLRARIGELEKQIAKLETAPTPEPETVVERVEVPVVDDETRAWLSAEVKAIAAGVEALQAIADELGNLILANVTPELPAAAKQGSASQRERSALSSSRRPDNGERLAPSGTAIPERPAEGAQEMRPATSAGRPDLTKAERAILTAIVQRPDSSRQIIAFLAQYSPTTSTFRSALGALRSAGLVAPGQPLRPLDGAAEALGGVDPLPSGAALRQFWLSRLDKAQAAILEVLIDAYPATLERAELATAAGYSETTSTFRSALGRLRSLELAERGTFRATDDLMAALGHA